MGTGDSTGTSMSAHSIPSPWPTTTLYHPFYQLTSCIDSVGQCTSMGLAECMIPCRDYLVIGYLALVEHSFPYAHYPL